jgi:hypothetical protein
MPYGGIMFFNRVNGKCQLKNILHYVLMGVRNEKAWISFDYVEYCVGLLSAGPSKKI